jgi:hypothetical protein
MTSPIKLPGATAKAEAPWFAPSVLRRTATRIDLVAERMQHCRGHKRRVEEAGEEVEDAID